jgi:hypothetical protein
VRPGIRRGKDSLEFFEQSAEGLVAGAGRQDLLKGGAKSRERWRCGSGEHVQGRLAEAVLLDENRRAERVGELAEEGSGTRRSR